MKQVVESGKTLLVDGTVSATLFSGEVEILGARFEIGSRVVIGEGTRITLEAKTKDKFDLFLERKQS